MRKCRRLGSDRGSPLAVGSQLTLSAVGQGVHGGQSPLSPTKLKSFSQFFFTTRHSTKTTNKRINYDDYRYYLQNPNDTIER
jgi:hypothetical protein